MNSQKVLVAGTGVSGIAAAKLLLAMGGEVVLYDANESCRVEDLKAKFEDKAKVEVVLGELKRTDLLGVELCIISPGIPMNSPVVKLLDDAGIPIWGELQLAYHCSKGRLAAITGTNGKTTTTALTGQILKDYFDRVFVVGNIGIPYSEVALETEDASVTVAEVSSFQLETIMDFHPQVSAILNITPDHLNRHGTMEQYIAVKKTITMNQTGEDTVVLNYDDPVLRSFGLKEKPEGAAEEDAAVEAAAEEAAAEKAENRTEDKTEDKNAAKTEDGAVEPAKDREAEEAAVEKAVKPAEEPAEPVEEEPNAFQAAMQENVKLEDLKDLTFSDDFEDLGAPRAAALEIQEPAVAGPSTFFGTYARPEEASAKQEATVAFSHAAPISKTTDDPMTSLEITGQEKEAVTEPQELELKAKVLFFSSTQKLEEGLYLEGDLIIWQHNGTRTELVNVHDLKLLGKHNYENVMAATAIALTLGVPIESIRKSITAFHAVEHRIEFVRERCGVKYYNDSKATNPDAAIKGIGAMPGPTILIAGGSEKNSQYDDWIESFGGKVRYLVLIGQTRDKIAKCAREHDFHEIMYAEDMQEAVRVCASYANMGENVLLSPACASFGMFQNYEERGRVFKECVLSL